MSVDPSSDYYFKVALLDFLVKLGIKNAVAKGYLEQFMRSSVRPVSFDDV